jgi:DNA-binding transcriptional ArsR family regulator/uncharacterized protein YndB with AHSA1/START domain
MTNISPIEAFSDPTRRQLLERLRLGPCSVSDLVSTVSVSQPAVSQHLRVLREARLVQVQQQGQLRIYSLRPEGLAELRSYLESFWDQVVGSYQNVAAQSTAEESAMSQSNPALEIAPVTKSFVVKLPIESAFHLFTTDVGRWWPLKTHSVFGDEATTCIVDAQVGGRFYEVHQDGRQSEWGRVLAWEPPHRLACTWHPGRGPETAQELEITFEEAPDGTQVTLVHTGWERLSGDGPATRANYDTGWDFVLGHYIEAAKR